MSMTCASCRRSDSQVFADAKALGLVQEFQCRIYTCCQISEWADEQWLAWSKAAHEDANAAEEANSRNLGFVTEPLLVPVRFRLPQVPWYRNADELS